MLINDINAITGLLRVNRAELSRRLEAQPQNISRTLNRSYITDEEAKKIYDALGLDLELIYKDKKTGAIIHQSKL